MLGPRFPLLSFESIYNFRRKAEVYPKPEPQPLPSQCEFLATHRVFIPAHLGRRPWGIVVAWLSHSVISSSCDPMDCSPPGSSVHGITQARLLEWVPISFSKGSSRPRDQTWVSSTAGRLFTPEPVGKSSLVVSQT